MSLGWKDDTQTSRERRDSGSGIAALCKGTTSTHLLPAIGRAAPSTASGKQRGAFSALPRSKPQHLLNFSTHDSEPNKAGGSFVSSFRSLFGSHKEWGGFARVLLPLLCELFHVTLWLEQAQEWTLAPRRLDEPCIKRTASDKLIETTEQFAKLGIREGRISSFWLTKHFLDNSDLCHQRKKTQNPTSGFFIIWILNM